MSSRSSHSKKLTKLPALPSGRQTNEATRGFTLIEMLVVIGIFVIITGVILADFPAFRDKTGLDLIAQEIATTIRQAQVYGIGTREAGTDFTSYGIYFDLSPSGSYELDNKSFYLYADRNFDSTSPATILATKGFTPASQTVPNCTTLGSDDCTIEKFAIRGAAKIADLQACDSSDCLPVLDPLKLDIFFQRFYPETEFIGTPSGNSSVKIVIQSTRDTTRQKEIQVWTTGQIVVKDV